MAYDERTYWENRYSTGGHSGAGSSGEEAEFKLAQVSKAVKRLRVSDVLDLGCGDGQFAERLMQTHPRLSYHGVDISGTAVDLCRARVPQGRFTLADFTTVPMPKSELVLCLDVLFHLSSDEKHEAAIATVCSSFTKTAIVAAWNEKILEEYSGKFAEHTFYRPFVPTEDVKVTRVIGIPTTPSKSIYLLRRR